MKGNGPRGRHPRNSERELCPEARPRRPAETPELGVGEAEGRHTRTKAGPGPLLTFPAREPPGRGNFRRARGPAPRHAPLSPPSPASRAAAFNCGKVWFAGFFGPGRGWGPEGRRGGGTETGGGVEATRFRGRAGGGGVRGRLLKVRIASGWQWPSFKGAGPRKVCGSKASSACARRAKGEPGPYASFPDKIPRESAARGQAATTLTRPADGACRESQ